ncbi:DUF6311 domain-containing protein [Anaeromyxobacter sp. SG17]|uniref:DUF6311 domain-containing protein n=1 Tax=Anaeromyxobacter sp. SG17 TaxID=2925405 RepID=UPI001F594E3E|nr:DUF6311 domain-containing protein [Anaeromyxobacter sp. SG17]
MRGPSEAKIAGPALDACAPEQRAPPVLGSLVRAHGPALAAAAVGIAWFASKVGLAVVHPSHVGWLMSGDWGANFVGWLFFRSAPISLPLGANPFYPFPVGSTLGFTDSIPLVAILLRPWASFLPRDFQYVGAWLLLAFALQGFVGAKLVKLATPHPAAQALGGALLALSPPLLDRLRYGHASLSAHWIVLVALWLALAPVEPRRVRGRIVAALLLVFLCAGVHPYFVVMTAALAAALVVRLVAVERLGGPALLLGGLASIAVAAAAGLFLFGFLGSGVRSEAQGFGFFSADLATLVNPMGWSRVIGSLPVQGGQYEGFGYLGAGALLLVLVGIGLTLALRGTRPSPGALARSTPIGAVTLLLFVFALSDAITFAGERILTLGLYALVPQLGSTFRSSGRFVWPLHYLIVLAAIAAVATALRTRPRALVAALALSFAAQAADVNPPEPLQLGTEPWRPPGSEVWELARGGYQHLAMYPPYLIAGGEPVAKREDECGPPVWPPDAQLGLAHVAYRLGLKFNGAYAARLDPDRAAAYCRELYGAVSGARLDPATIYVVRPQQVEAFRRAHGICGRVDGAPVCVSGERDGDPFARAVRMNPLP